VSDLPEFGTEFEHEEPVIRDKRRVNPDGSVREPDPSAAPAAQVPPAAPTGGPADGPAGEDPRIAELTDTLQRLKAEYDNYRKRTERDRSLAGDVATANVLTQLLPVLDDVDRARAHGDLTGAFGAVGDALVSITAKLGLETYGEAGDAFDPQVHDAVLQAEPVAGTAVPVAAQIFRPGFRFAGRVLRPAQVAVAEPAPEGGDGPTEQSPTEG
jgi:molecular chaperone GrpE